jgi:prevent-host-death family protein
MVTNDTVVTMKTSRVSVPAGEFKAKCLALLDQVEMRGQSFIVTKRGRPVAQVMPLPSTTPRSLRGSLVHESDLLAPIHVKWGASR